MTVAPRFLVSFTALALFLLSGISVATAQIAAQEIAQRAFRSTVLLVMEDSNGQPLSIGSGFFVRDGHIATNLHVVEGASRGYAKLVGQNEKYDIEGITAIDAERDLVVLKVRSFGPQLVLLGNSDRVQVGETVYAVGNPHGLEGTFSDGIISSIRYVGSSMILQITAPLSPGSSGGPVLNRRGEVIGISVITIRNGQNLNFAIPSSYLLELLAHLGPAQPLWEKQPAKSQRSILAGLGGRGVEGVAVGKLIWTYSALQSGKYSFSIRNHLRQRVRDVRCLGL